MTAGWVKVFDQSFQRVPIARLKEMYAGGFRVMAGYAGGGSSTKWLTTAEIKTWLGLGPDTGIFALFEGVGTEAINNPGLGDDNAKAARSAWRLRGYPDNASISPAVDRNISVAQAKAAITQYFTNWNNTDTCKPIPYIEKDGGAILFAEKLTAGTGTPAAFSWDPSDVLVTPDNAPSHVVWTQEHNGISMAGGDIDIGHIRLTAPIQWKATPEMELTDTLSNGKTVDQALTAVFSAATPSSVWHNNQFTPKLDASGKPVVPTVYTETGSGRMDRLDKMATYVMSPKFIADIAAASAGGADAATIAVAVANEIDRRMDA